MVKMLQLQDLPFQQTIVHAVVPLLHVPIFGPLALDFLRQDIATWQPWKEVLDFLVTHFPDDAVIRDAVDLSQ